MSSKKFIKLRITLPKSLARVQKTLRGGKYYWKIGNYKNTPCKPKTYWPILVLGTCRNHNGSTKANHSQQTVYHIFLLSDSTKIRVGF